MSKESNALISWIGDTDMIDYYHSLPSQELQMQFLRLFPNDRNKKNFAEKLKDPPEKYQSPIKVILQERGSKIDEIHLITNRLAIFFKNHNSFKNFIHNNCPTFKGKVIIHDCEDRLPRITELSGVYTITQEILSRIRDTCGELHCNISSGVGVTAAALIMLASAYFEKLHILQVYKASVNEDPLPEKFSSLILKRSVKTEENFDGSKIIGQSVAIQKILKTAHRIAPFDYSVLLLGPSGTGKSTLAREIHELSHRRDAKFEYVNCGSLTPTLLESKLYGHKAGAYTDAKEDRDGVFKTADKGTVFLDEVADCTLEMQATLLHVLQPEDPDQPTIRKFRPLGAASDETSDVRVIAATNKNIKKLIRDGKFREDLYYRLATSTINIPGLTGREEDIPLLAQSCLDQINRHNKSVPGFSRKDLSADAVEVLKRHNWTGNVRELQNVLQQAAIMTDSGTITADDLVFQLEADESEIPDPESFSLENIKADLERRYIAAAIDVTGGNRAKASRLLGMKTPQNLESRIKALKMNVGG